MLPVATTTHPRVGTRWNDPLRGWALHGLGVSANVSTMTGCIGDPRADSFTRKAVANEHDLTLMATDAHPSVRNSVDLELDDVTAH